MKSSLFPAALLARTFSAVASLLLLAICDASPCRGEDFHNSLSLQGYTGLLNTPNAAVTGEGKLYALFSNQQESKWRERTPRQENYLFSVGLFSFCELGGRLTEAPDTLGPGTSVRDLSGNVKVALPFLPKGGFWPAVAFGVQDIGGGARHLQTAYAVASEELWRLRLSLGYGIGPDRLKGVFGGVEIKAWDWLYLIGENDTEETNVGIRLITPTLFGYPVNLNVTAKSSLDNRPERVEFGVGLQFPLGSDHHSIRPMPAAAEWGAQPFDTVSEVAAALDHSSHPPRDKSPRPGGKDPLLRLRDALAEEGFQNIRVGEKEGGLLVVEYENSRYNWNELDGLGVAAGTALAYAPPGCETLRLVMKKKNIRTLQFSAPVRELAEFMRAPVNVGKLAERVEITADVADDEGVRFVGSGNPSFLHSSLVFYPELKTFVATEVGVFDYFLSVKPDLHLNLWKGAELNARWEIPVAWSGNFDDGKAFRNSRHDSRMDRLMLFQAVRLAPTVMANLGGGMILHDRYGTLNELRWSPGEGSHRLTFRQAYAEDGEGRTAARVYLGSYRYYASKPDLYLEGTGGRFLGGDTGFTLELKRFFGDTAFSVFYKNSAIPGGERVQAGGVRFAFPLTPRRDMKPYLVQLRGSDEWSYAQETEIARQGEQNVAGVEIGVDPKPPFNLERVFYNRDRLTPAYIRKHLLRLRDACLRYCGDTGGKKYNAVKGFLP